MRKHADDEVMFHNHPGNHRFEDRKFNAAANQRDMFQHYREDSGFGSYQRVEEPNHWAKRDSPSDRPEPTYRQTY